MNTSIKLGQGLAWAAWLVFVISMFLPMETHNLAGPCAWPCKQPFTNYGYQNASFFVLSMIAFPLKLLEAIYIVAFDPLTLRRILESYLTIGLYAIIGLGQFLIVLAPLWPVKIKKPSWQKLHLGLGMASVLAVLVYGLFPTLRMGLELLESYYLWALSFFLLLIASLLMLDKESQEASAKEGQFTHQQL
jgi:hypothetical protein